MHFRRKYDRVEQERHPEESRELPRLSQRTHTYGESLAGGLHIAH